MENDKLPAGPVRLDSPESRRSWRRLPRWGQRSVTVAVVLVVVLVLTPAGDWLGEPLIHVDPPERADYIVVLGGASERAVEAARLYRDGWAPKLILSSHGAAADYLADIACAYGVPDSALVLDRQAARTADHPDSIARAAGLDRSACRLLVVTSTYHTSRARAAFAKAGYEHVLVRPPDWTVGGDFRERPSATTRWRELPVILHELGGWVYYRVRGWV